MIVDLRLEGRNVVVFGGGKTAERRVRQLLESKARVVVLASGFTRGLAGLRRRGLIRAVRLRRLTGAEIARLEAFKEAFLVLAHGEDRRLNREVVELARGMGKLAAAVDEPDISDMAFPAVARLGSVRVTISTGGKSPAMAKLLRSKLEELFTGEELRQVEVQAYARSLAKRHIADAVRRRRFLYRLIRSRKLKRLLQAGRMAEARGLVRSLIQKEAGQSPSGPR